MLVADNYRFYLFCLKYFLFNYLLDNFLFPFTFFKLSSVNTGFITLFILLSVLQFVFGLSLTLIAICINLSKTYNIKNCIHI